MEEVKIRKVGNSLTMTVPKAVASRMNVAEGDAVYITEIPGDGYRMTPHDPELVDQMRALEDLTRRYRNTLKALGE